MMSFLRGGKSSAAASPSAGESSPQTPSSNQSYSHSPSFSSNVGTVGPQRPLRLVYCDEKGKFQMDPEAVAALQLVKGPIGVVSVCGRARQGKSYILNQLLGRSSGFQVASTHRPCTKGLWMWSAPIKRMAIDGSEYNLLLLDSEGIDAYDQTGTYSTQIFSLAVLLSSMFIYNQMGGIDEPALDRLSLVTEMTKRIRVRASEGRSSPSELGQFSPVFVWLLRDFYLDLAEDNRKITPRDYLELALRPVQGGREVAAKNEIRESIRALFPDRECFTLKRPSNDEKELQQLDQIPLQKLRTEFREGLDAFTKFVFERTKPKQVGATVMTGPVLAGLTQAFLKALNEGAVPTITTSWQSVEELECHRAFTTASDVYKSSFDHSKPAEEAHLREAHEFAVQKSIDAFNMNAVGAGLIRQKYEKQLQEFFKKEFQEFSRKAFLEAELQCSNAIHRMENKLRAACHVADANFDQVIQVLNKLISEYNDACHGPAKWQKLVPFLQRCLDGPILALFKRQCSQLETERATLNSKLGSMKDQLDLYRKQIDANEKHRADYMKRYEEAISDKRKVSEDYSNHIANLQTKKKSLEENFATLTKALDSAKLEASDWKLKYEHICSEFSAEEDKYKKEITILKGRSSTVESRLAAAREQAMSAQEEALEWKRKYDIASGEAKSALERAAIAQERTSKKAQEREDSLRAEFSVQLANKEDEMKHMEIKLGNSEARVSSLLTQLQAHQSKLRDQESEGLTLKGKMKELEQKLEDAIISSKSYENEARVLEQEKFHLEEKYISEFKKFEEADMRCKAAEREAKRATELADNARADASAANKERSKVQQLAMERLAQIERTERMVETLQREKAELEAEAKKLHLSESEANRKVILLEERVEEREREIEQMMNQNNEQRSSTVQVLESLLATERTARAEANKRAETLSLQLQSTQSKLDVLHQELASVKLNETALGSKLRTASHGKRSRVDDYAGVESVRDMDIDQEPAKGRKRRTKSTTSPLKAAIAEDGGSIFTGEENNTPSQPDFDKESEDYTKFTILKLKQELTKKGFGAELLQLKNPNKKDILGLYEKHVLNK